MGVYRIVIDLQSVVSICRMGTSFRRQYDSKPAVLFCEAAVRWPFLKHADLSRFLWLGFVRVVYITLW